MRTTINKTIVTYKLGRELLTAGIMHNGMSVFGNILEILLVNENQSPQAQAVVDAHTGVDTVEQRQTTAEGNLRNIPGWSTWSESDVLVWWNTNLSDTQTDAVLNLADARAMLKKQNAAIKHMARMLIAMRDRMFPNVPEG